MKIPLKLVKTEVKVHDNSVQTLPRDALSFINAPTQDFISEDEHLCNLSKTFTNALGNCEVHFQPTARAWGKQSCIIAFQVKCIWVALNIVWFYTCMRYLLSALPTRKPESTMFFVLQRQTQPWVMWTGAQWQTFHTATTEWYTMLINLACPQIISNEYPLVAMISILRYWRQGKGGVNKSCSFRFLR